MSTELPSSILAALGDDQIRLRVFLDDLWRWKCGLPPRECGDFESFCSEQWSLEFERLMRNRLILGALRYGPLGAKGKPQYDRIASIKKRLDAYAANGNLEMLVDAANLALLEFVEGDHPKRHFRAAGVESDTDEHHVQVRESAK
jgi:hypothetical protein